MSLVCRNSICT